MRAFKWRDDATGQEVARALLDAADRGVKVTIYKDQVGAHYEYFEGNGQSFFHKRLPPKARFETLFIITMYLRWGRRPQRPSELADALRDHENVDLRVEGKTFDHAKLYIIDDEYLIFGGVGIGDDSRYDNLDYMVEVGCEHTLRRFHARSDGAAFDPDRPVDFLIHNKSVHPRHRPPLLSDRLNLIRSAQRTLLVEMAYLGHPEFTDALVDAVKRGVHVTLVTSARANILGALARYTCNQLIRRTGAPDNLRVVFHPKFVHSKAMVIDGERAELGSANFTPISHGVYDEVGIHVHDAAFAQAVAREIEKHADEGTRAYKPVRYSRIYAVVEWAIVTYQGRGTR
ncbi:MAG: phosphatidylserine/phosphatidylglycerophosphate/cardiolipin synthase family protein [Myxococcales bacterium]|nr:phosphatidylserine/phosphatidylglycerophosphate/cardiolipin synthase family protein [Myxococcales bacterium]